MRRPATATTWPSEVLARAGDAPAMSIELYRRHLPYAMALGVESLVERALPPRWAGLVDPSLHEYQRTGARHGAASARAEVPSAVALSSSTVDASAGAASTPPASVVFVLRRLFRGAVPRRW